MGIQIIIHCRSHYGCVVANLIEHIAPLDLSRDLVLFCIIEGNKG